MSSWIDSIDQEYKNMLNPVYNTTPKTPVVEPVVVEAEAKPVVVEGDMDTKYYVDEKKCVQSSDK